MIKHKVAKIEEFKNFIPLSTSCFDTQFHDKWVVAKFVDIVTKGLGKRGLFPSRNCSHHLGHPSYLGKRSERSQHLPNPSEGPGKHDRWYYRQHVYHVYWPFLLKLYNRLGQAASRLDFYLYKYLAVLFPFKNSHSSNIGYSRLLIATINFDCSNHCDTVDQVSDDVK